MSKTVSANSIRIILDSAHSSYNPLTVLAGVTVTGGGYGVVSDASRIWTITNQGTIQGTLSTGAGIDLFDGGVVQNNGSAAHITGGSRGLYIEGGAGTVTNQGTISATTTSGTGLDLLSGGTVVNSGLISGGQYGISAAGNPTTVINQGEISQFGTYGYGMYLFAGGQVTNSSTAAFIKGFFDGIASGGYVDILNKGNIQGTAATGNGINMFAGGKVANSGVNSYIYGGNNGVWAQVSTAAVSNQGVILGGGNGVLLAVGGSVTNIGGSSYIYGHNDGVLAGGNAVVVNQGGIDGGHGYGVYLDAGGVVTNSGVITGYFDGFASTGDATVFNQGSISGSQASGNGINLFAGGTVTNSGLHARIAGPRRGVWVQGSAGTVINQGTIAGGDTISRGLEFAAGGLVSNNGTGAVISGGQYGVLASIGGVTVVNQGVISGGPGIGVKSGATAATTISNAGTISGGTAAVQFGNVDGNLFRLLPRAVAIGAVQGGTGVDTLALGAGVPVGFIAGIGSQFTGFEALDVDADANWRMTGANALGASATIDVAGAGRLSVIGTLTAPANLTITGDGVLTAAASGRIEVGTLASAHAGQIVVDAGHTLVTGGGLLASVIRNLGSISGPGANGYGVHLVAAASVTNFGTAARISGGLYGVYASDHSATLVNQGGISGAAGQGVHLGAGGTVANNGAAASISGAQNGIYANGAAATVTNQGTIAATSGDGIDLAAGGVLTNGAGAARISGTADGVVTGGAATIVNAGSISGASADGVYLGAGGAVSNGSTAARISGGQWGVDAYGGVATITNHGTIAGATGAVRFGNASGNLLRLFPGAVTGGAARGGSGVDTLALGSGATVGTITGIGTAFTGFEVLAVDAGARWLAAGANTMLPTATIALADGGSLGVSGTLVAPASLTITGTGTLAANGGHIEVGTGAAALANQVVIDAGRTLTSSGVLSAAQVIVASGGLLIGTGAAIGAVANSGKIQALGGTLTVPGNLSGGGTLQSAPGATLTLNGAANTTAVAIDNGIVSVGAGASLDITGSVFAPSTGLFTLNDASFLELAADTGGANRISFAGPAGSELIVDAIAKFGTNVGLGTYSGPLLQNFGGAGDEIDLKNLALAGATKLYNPATGLLQLGNGPARATLRFENSSLTGSDFQLGNDTTGHVLLTHV